MNKRELSLLGLVFDVCVRGCVHVAFYVCVCMVLKSMCAVIKEAPSFSTYLRGLKSEEWCGKDVLNEVLRSRIRLLRAPEVVCATIFPPVISQCSVLLSSTITH